jgi:hypothetical protein
VRLKAGEGEEKARLGLWVTERGLKVETRGFVGRTAKGAMGLAGGALLSMGTWKPVGVGGRVDISGAPPAWVAC